LDLWLGGPDTAWEKAQEALEARGVTDGLPVVPPTSARVDAMLEANRYAPDVLVSNLAPMFQPATWRDIAINAVMAGCRADYLPVIGAALEALAADEFNLMGVTTTTGSAAPLIIVNGPVAARIGMNCAANALGPGNRANATIGRAISLCLRNIGGAAVGEIDMATLGQPAKYGCCFAENEAQSPWAPLHVERGYAAGESVVTVFGVSGIVEVIDSASGRGEEIAQTFAQSMLIAGTAGGSGMLGSGEPLLIVPPELAATCQRDGYSKQMLKAAIFERAVMPLERLSPAVREHLIGRRAGDDPAAADSPLRVAHQAGDVMIVVAGGVGVKAAYVPTWSTSRAVSRLVKSVTK
jgi:hypothetical protein